MVVWALGGQGPPWSIEPLGEFLILCPWFGSSVDSKYNNYWKRSGKNTTSVYSYCHWMWNAKFGVLLQRLGVLLKRGRVKLSVLYVVGARRRGVIGVQSTVLKLCTLRVKENVGQFQLFTNQIMIIIHRAFWIILHIWGFPMWRKLKSKIIWDYKRRWNLRKTWGGHGWDLKTLHADGWRGKQGKRQLEVDRSLPSSFTLLLNSTHPPTFLIVDCTLSSVYRGRQFASCALSPAAQTGSFLLFSLFSSSSFAPSLLIF